MNTVIKFVLSFMLPYASLTIGHAEEPAEESAKTAIVTCAEDCGMFRTLASVVGFLHLYETGRYEGLVIDFGAKGLYYDPAYGNNWWSYYFEPLSLGQISQDSCVKSVNGPSDTDCAMLTEFGLYKNDVHALLNKYVKLKPYIKKQVNAFAARHFKGHPVIGVHYRGTDKTIEAPRSEHEIIVGHIQDMTNEILSTNPSVNAEQIRIFIATDESAFLESMQAQYGQRVVYRKQALRSLSEDPVHKAEGNGYKKGEDALLDCLLLSRCQRLIKTSSNLSLFSTYFNPDIPVTHVTARHWRLPLE